MNCFENSLTCRVLQFTFWERPWYRTIEKFSRKAGANWLCISKGSGSSVFVPLPKLAEEAGALAQG